MTPASQAYGLSLLDNVVNYEAWAAGIVRSSKVAVALKNGWYPFPTGWQINSVGWVRGMGRNYIIAMMSRYNPNSTYAVATLNFVSTYVFNHLAPSSAPPRQSLREKVCQGSVVHLFVSEEQEPVGQLEPPPRVGPTVIGVTVATQNL